MFTFLFLCSLRTSRSCRLEELRKIEIWTSTDLLITCQLTLLRKTVRYDWKLQNSLYMDLDIKLWLFPRSGMNFQSQASTDEELSSCWGKMGIWTSGNCSYNSMTTGQTPKDHVIRSKAPPQQLNGPRGEIHLVTWLPDHLSFLSQKSFEDAVIVTDGLILILDTKKWIKDEAFLHSWIQNSISDIFWRVDGCCCCWTLTKSDNLSVKMTGYIWIMFCCYLSLWNFRIY